MPIVKKRNERTEARLLLESDEPVELPPAEIEEKQVVLQFETLRPFIPELVEALREGTLAEPVPVMLDGSTFVVHGATRSFWVKLWHAGGDLSRIERAQVISCMPSTRGVQIIVGELEEEDFDEDDFDDEDSGHEDFYEGDDDLAGEDEDDPDDLEESDDLDEASASADDDSPADDKDEPGVR
ncbi:MAG TPA: hypothetical protein VGB73_16230 [Pyrinomonadaceae bacterium]|jgi:hypothetical protein